MPGCLHAQCMLAGDNQVQKRMTDPLELEIQAVVSHPLWVLGTEHGSSAKAGSALNYGAISQALWLFQMTHFVLWNRKLRNGWGFSTKANDQGASSPAQGGLLRSKALLLHRLPLAAEIRGCLLVCSPVGGMRKSVLVWHAGLLQSLHSVTHRSSVLWLSSEECHTVSGRERRPGGGRWCVTMIKAHCKSTHVTKYHNQIHWFCDWHALINNVYQQRVTAAPRL